MYQDAQVYFPQDEARSAFLPVTLGCAHNLCAFCPMYKDQAYARVPLADLKRELIHLDPYTEKIFLTGGDPLSIGFEPLLEILKLIRLHRPLCARLASYASVASINQYRADDLSLLHQAGLRLLYMGFETGRGDLLLEMKKGHGLQEALTAGDKLKGASLAFDAIFLYGLGGRGEASGRASARLVNDLSCRRLITMNLTLFPNTPLYRRARSGEFLEASREEKLEELYSLVQGLDPVKPLLFDSSHPTNLLKMKGELPQDRDRILDTIQRALWGYTV